MGGKWWFGNRGSGSPNRLNDVNILPKGVSESGGERVRRGGAGGGARHESVMLQFCPRVRGGHKTEPVSFI